MNDAPPRYDAFLSYDPADAAWVESWLVPRLVAAGLRIATTADFAIGVPAPGQHRALHRREPPTYIVIWVS
jgi:hypothetical protein